MAEVEDVLSALGLRINLRPLVVTLGEGVVLTARPPEADDWAAARAEVAKVFCGVEALKSAAQRYGWDRSAQVGLADAANWEVRAERCLLAELAALVVERIERKAGGVVLEGPFEVGAFNQLFRRGGNLDVFRARMKEADDALIVAKKGSEPSSDISGRAAGSTATDAPE